MAARGHFEIYRNDSLKGPGTGFWRWRFIDREGHALASSRASFDTPQGAKEDAGEFVIELRTATYGQRFPADIAAAVVEV